MSNPQIAFDPDPWLDGEALELKPLLQLARGVDPTSGDWPPPSLWYARWRRLKIEIDEDRLPAKCRGSEAHGRAIVYLEDLWAFVTEPNRLSRDTWAWARDFCQRWAEVLGKTLPDPLERRAATIGAETQCKKWLIDNMSGGKPKLHPKKYYEAEAKKLYQVGPRPFRRAWDSAIRETGNTGWSRSGRPKS